MTHERYLVPRFSFSDREPLRTALFECLDELAELGFEFIESAHHESDTNRLTRFSDEPETSHIELWEDYLAQVRYLRIEAPNASVLSELVEATSRVMPIESLDALLASMRTSPDAATIYRIGYSAPGEPSAETVQAVVTALQSGDVDLATAAAEVAGIIGWPTFSAPLRVLEAETEPGRLRQAVRQALEVLSRQ